MNIYDLIKIKQELNKQIEEPLVPALIKDGFPIPSPDKGEKESDYINRCMGAIGSEYDTQEQALAVCYAQLKN